MTREKAKQVIYAVINSGIITEQLEDDLTEIVNSICEDDWELCRGTAYCDDCRFRRAKKDNEV